MKQSTRKPPNDAWLAETRAGRRAAAATRDAFDALSELVANAKSPDNPAYFQRWRDARAEAEEAWQEYDAKAC